MFLFYYSTPGTVSLNDISQCFNDLLNVDTINRFYKYAEVTYEKNGMDNDST